MGGNLAAAAGPRWHRPRRRAEGAAGRLPSLQVQRPWPCDGGRMVAGGPRRPSHSRQRSATAAASLVTSAVTTAVAAAFDEKERSGVVW